jgi:hypothetical protein
MRKLFLLSIIGISILLSVSANAAMTAAFEIKQLKIQGNGTNFVLDGFSNADPNISCGSNGFWMAETAENYSARTSMLLAAYMSGKAVAISYYECESGLIKAASIQLSK